MVTDPARLAQWCATYLGSSPAEEIFRSGHLSEVIGLRLTDGREVVVKIRPSSPRIPGCVEVQRRLFQAGYPCPEPLTDALEFGKEGWHEMAHITWEQIQQKFGDECNMIYCCGAGDFIYVHYGNSRYLLIFDMVQKQWQWSTHCPIEIRNEWNPTIFGFCFEPNFKINC